MVNEQDDEFYNNWKKIARTHWFFYCFLHLAISVSLLLTPKILCSPSYRNWQKLKQNAVALTTILGKTSNSPIFLQNSFVHILITILAWEFLYASRSAEQTACLWGVEIKIIIEGILFDLLNSDVGSWLKIETYIIPVFSVHYAHICVAREFDSIYV